MTTGNSLKLSSILLTSAILLCTVVGAVLLWPAVSQTSRSATSGTGSSNADMAEVHRSKLEEFFPGQNKSSRDVADLPVVPRELTRVAMRESAVGADSDLSLDVPVPVAPDSDGQQTIRVERRVTTGRQGSGDVVPQVYVPVTVHPVTVHLDTSTFATEVARVSERIERLIQTASPVSNPDSHDRLDQIDQRLDKLNVMVSGLSETGAASIRRHRQLGAAPQGRTTIQYFAAGKAQKELPGDSEPDGLNKDQVEQPAVAETPEPTRIAARDVERTTTEPSLSSELPEAPFVREPSPEFHEVAPEPWMMEPEATSEPAVFDFEPARPEETAPVPQQPPAQFEMPDFETEPEPTTEPQINALQESDPPPAFTEPDFGLFMQEDIPAPQPVIEEQQYVLPDEPVLQMQHTDAAVPLFPEATSPEPVEFQAPPEPEQLTKEPDSEFIEGLLPIPTTSQTGPGSESHPEVVEVVDWLTDEEDEATVLDLKADRTVAEKLPDVWPAEATDVATSRIIAAPPALKLVPPETSESVFAAELPVRSESLMDVDRHEVIDLSLLKPNDGASKMNAVTETAADRDLTGPMNGDRLQTAEWVAADDRDSYRDNGSVKASYSALVPVPRIVPAAKHVSQPPQAGSSRAQQAATHGPAARPTQATTQTVSQTAYRSGAHEKPARQLAESGQGGLINGSLRSSVSDFGQRVRGAQVTMPQWVTGLSDTRPVKSLRESHALHRMKSVLRQVTRPRNVK